MERKPWLKKLAGLFGVNKGSKEHFTVSLPTTANTQRPLHDARRSRHSDFPSKSMRRGVQRSLERRQRGARLFWIVQSIAQALQVRKLFREKQLVKREIRAQLRAIPNPLLLRSDTPLEFCYAGGVSPIFCKSKRHAQSLWPKDKGQG